MKITLGGAIMKPMTTEMRLARIRTLHRWIGGPLHIFKIIAIPLLTLYALYRLVTGNVTVLDLSLLLMMHVPLGLGITVGFHRMETHKSFKPHPLVRFMLIAFGSMTFQGPVTFWVASHIKHHSISDHKGDPHSPRDGFWHSHVLWVLTQDWANLYGEYEKRFVKDKMLMFFEETYILWTLLAAAIPFLIGGWSGFLWGFAVAIFVNNNITYLVNSFTHTFGKQEFDTDDDSGNCFWMGFFGFGEGWHNNHHAFPKSAYHGFKWYQIDISGYFITLLERLGWIKDVYRVRPEVMASKRLQVKDRERIRPAASNSDFLDTSRSNTRLKRESKRTC